MQRSWDCDSLALQSKGTTVKFLPANTSYAKVLQFRAEQGSQAMLVMICLALEGGFLQVEGHEGKGESLFHLEHS